MQDEVDELSADWLRERPDLPVAPMGIWSRIKRLEIYLDQARRAAYAEHGLDVSEFDVLAALRRSGDPYRLSPGQLIRETHVTSGTMTNRIDRLVARGFVQRESHPQDGRAVLVTLTAAGRQVVDAAITRLLEAEEELLAKMDQGQRGRLADDLRDLILLLQD